MVECNIQKSNGINFHTSLLLLSQNPNFNSAEKKVEKLLFFYIKLHVLATILATLYGLKLLLGAE
jgi:hypothetical protein